MARPAHNERVALVVLVDMAGILVATEVTLAVTARATQRSSSLLATCTRQRTGDR